MEKPTTAQSFWVAPFEDGPLAVLEEVFRDADHLSQLESGGEHIANGLTSGDGAFGDLMVDRVWAIESGERVDVRAIESIDPDFYNVTRTHHLISGGRREGRLR